MRRVSEELGRAAREACARRGFSSLRQAEMQTGVNYTVLARLLKGEVPSAAAVIRWAVSLGSDPNQWLKLAGHDLLPEGPQGKIALVGAVQRGEPSLTFTQPEPPELVRTMIERATTREDKIAVAFNYLASLPDVRLGADTGSANADARLHIIRTYERLTNVQVLPPEVV